MQNQKTGLMRQEQRHLPASEKNLQQDEEAQENLALLISQCFNGLNVYGKDMSQLSDTTALFALALADFPASAILPAFKLFLQRESRMPTPADIVKIIKRGNKAPLEQSVYVALCQKRERTSFEDAGQHGNCLSLAEEQYIKDYELEAGVT